MTAFAPCRTRSALFLGCALAALYQTGSAGRAEAQAFNADPTTGAGVVTYDRATPGVETVTIETPTAIINWTPNVAGNPIIFLPAGNTATFVNGINIADFAVLNRIIATVPVRFDGTVISRLQNLSTGTSQAGGTIIFESPGGIIIGAKSMFDVGNLILTSLNVAVNSGEFIDPTGAIQFAGGNKFPNAAVITEPGAQIHASTQGSYVAMIAPVVQHGGNLQVNGSAAYVAAEQVEFRVNSGLFDIIVGVGSANAVPLLHTGTTGGPASTGAGDLHNIYMVAVPKNQAITAVLQGNIGFDPAISAAVENGAIILSSGHSVVGGAVDQYADSSPPPVAGVGASFEIRGGTVTSDLSGYAVTDMLASGSALGFLNFKQDVSLFGGARAHLFAGASETVTVGGDALVSAAHLRSADGALDQAGGDAGIFAQAGGSVDITGGAIVDASGQGVVDPAASIAGSGTGGTATIYADNGDVHIAGPATVRATGAGGTVDFVPNQGGFGLGGAAAIEGRNGGSVRLGGDLAMDAGGTGSRSNGSLGLDGANGTGGDAHVAATGGGTVTVAGGATLAASGTGGEVTGGSGLNGGIGQGGAVSLSAGGTVAIGGDATLTADATGGDGPVSGIANGGIVTLAASTPGGSLTAGNVTGTALATGPGASGNSPGQWHVSAGTGGSIRFNNLTLTAAVSGPAATLPFSSLEPLGGSIMVTGTATLATPADIQVTGSGAGTASGGLFDLDAGGDILVTHPARGGNFTIDVTDLDMNAQNVTVAAGAATRASNRTNVAALGALTVGGLMDGREIVGTAASVDAGAGGAIGGAATELTDIRVTGNASVAGAILGRDILIVSNALNVAGTGAVGGAGTDQVELRTTATAAIAGRVLGGSILITAADVNVASTGAIGDAATTQTEIDATGNATIAGTVLGGNILVASNALSVTGNVGGAGTARTELRTTGNSAISGRVLGGSILITAADVNLASAGTVGDAATTQTEIDATGNATIAGTVLGGNILVASNALSLPGNVGGAGTTRTELRTTGNSAIAGRVLGGSILLTAADVNVAATGAIGDAATTQTEIDATGNATISGTVLGGNILVASNALTLSGNVGGAGTTQTELRTIGNSAISGRVLGRSILATAASLNISASGAVGDATTQLADLRATGAASVAGAVLGRTINVQGATVTVAGTGAVGAAATDQTRITAVGSASVAGAVLGRDIRIASTDINLTGSVGDGSTTQTEIDATGNATVAGTVLGGSILVASNTLNLSGTVGGAGTGQTELRTTGSSTITGRVLGQSILATAGSVTVAAAGAVGDGATVQTEIDATASATIAGSVQGGKILIASNSLNLSGTVGGAGTTQTELRTAGNSAITGRVLGQSILATAAALNVGATGAVGDAATQLADLRATGNASVAGTVLGRSINVQGATVTLAAGGAIGGAGTDQTRLTALGNAAIVGTVLGRDIQISSADIDLTGSVGNAGTQAVTLAVGGTPAPGQFTLLGGSAAGPGYTLTSAEAARIRADALRITVPALAGGAGRPPDLIIRDLTFAGGGAGAGIGTLDIATPGIARVEGNLLLAGARPADGIALRATERLEVPTPTGSVRVRDAGGAPGGTLLLASNNLWVASSAIIDRLRLDPAYIGRDAELLDNGGTDVPRGYVEAGGVTLNTGGTLFVQNTGSSLGTLATGFDFAGVTVGAGGLTVRSTGGTPATVTAFGRTLNADGSFTTGYDFFFAVNFQAPAGSALSAGFTAPSTFNTCIIVTGQCPARAPINAVPGHDPTTGPTGNSDSIQLPAASDADDLVDTSFATDPLIEEPVTSGGESVIWEGDCDHDNDGDCDEVHP